MSLRLDDGPAANRSFGGAIMGPVSLRVSLDAIANDLEDARVEDDAERWCDIEVAGRG